MTQEQLSMMEFICESFKRLTDGQGTIADTGMVRLVLNELTPIQLQNIINVLGPDIVKIQT